MKVLAKSLLVMAASLGAACGQAHAQYESQGSSALLPLPAVTPLGVMTTSYNERSNVGLYGGTTASAAPQMAYQGNYSTAYAQQGAPSTIPSPTAPSVIDQAPLTGGTDFEDAVQDGSLGGCGECGTCSPACCCRAGWFGAAGGLIMGRSRPNPYWTTYETNNNVNQLMNTGNAQSNWGGGFIVSGGYMCCDCCGNLGPGIGVTYWGAYGLDATAGLTSNTNQLSTPINLQTQTGDVMIGPNPAGSYFDSAAEHQIQRSDNVNSFEINGFLPLYMSPNLQVIGLAGFRYFRFDEFLGFSASQTLGMPPADTAYLNFDCVNNMYGAQIGFIGNWMIGQRWGLFAGPKVGVFSNQMAVNTQLFNGNGDYTYNIHAYKSDFSMLAELDTGVTYFWRPNVFTFVGYKLVAVSNVALADNQFLPYLADEQGFREIKQNGTVFLQGVMFGGGILF